NRTKGAGSPLGEQARGRLRRTENLPGGRPGIPRHNAVAFGGGRMSTTWMITPSRCRSCGDCSTSSSGLIMPGGPLSCSATTKFRKRRCGREGRLLRSEQSGCSLEPGFHRLSGRRARESAAGFPESQATGSRFPGSMGGNGGAISLQKITEDRQFVDKVIKELRP